METKEKETFLIEKGYSQEYLKMVQEPRYKYARLTLDELIWFESLAGKIVTTFSGRTVKVTKVEPSVSGCMIFFEGGCFPVGKRNIMKFRQLNLR